MKTVVTFHFGFVIFSLILLLLSLTFPTVSSNCLSLVDLYPNAWIPIIVRAPIGGGSIFTRNLAITQQYLLNEHGLSVRMGPQPPSANCAGTTSDEIRFAGFEVELCYSPQQISVSATPAPFLTNGWCSSPQDGSPRAILVESWMDALLSTKTLHTASSQIIAFGDFVLTNLFTYLNNCDRPIPTQCFGSKSLSAARTGNSFVDGIQDGRKEECDISEAYFPSKRSDPLDSLVGRCKRSKNDLLDVEMSYEVAGAYQVNDHTKWCLDQKVCGTYIYSVISYSCTSKSILDQGACFNNIGLAHLAPDLAPQSCYSQPFSEACQYSPASWLCSISDSEWVSCTPAIGQPSVLRTTVVSINPTFDEVTPLTSSNFSCGTLYRARRVKCGLSKSPNSSSVHPDSSCSIRGPKPAETISLSETPCTNVVFAYSYPSSGNVPAIPSLQAFRNIVTQNPQNIPVPQYSTPCTTSHSSIPCFGNCGTSYAIYYKCVTFTVADTNTQTFSVSETGDCSALLFSSLVNTSTFKNLLGKNVCTYTIQCHDSILSSPKLCTSYTCQCDISQVHALRSCFSSPLADSSAFLRVDSSFCGISSPEQDYYTDPCVVKNEENRCYDPIITFSGGDDPLLPFVDWNTPSVFVDAKYNNYCIVENGFNFGVWNTKMTIGCQYSYQPTGPLDSSLCPSTILNANKFFCRCQI